MKQINTHLIPVLVSSMVFVNALADGSILSSLADTSTPTRRNHVAKKTNAFKQSSAEDLFYDNINYMEYLHSLEVQIIENENQSKVTVSVTNTTTTNPVSSANTANVVNNTKSPNSSNTQTTNTSPSKTETKTENKTESKNETKTETKSETKSNTTSETVTEKKTETPAQNATTNTSTESKQVESPKVEKGTYMGVLNFPGVGLSQYLYTDTKTVSSQDIVDNADSAYYGYYYSGNVIIGDHVHQGFSKIKSASKGMTVYVCGNEYVVAEVIPNAKKTSDRYHITYANGTYIESNYKNCVILYTCNSNAFDITVVVLQKPQPKVEEPKVEAPKVEEPVVEQDVVVEQPVEQQEVVEETKQEEAVVVDETVTVNEVVEEVTTETAPVEQEVVETPVVVEETVTVETTNE